MRQIEARKQPRDRAAGCYRLKDILSELNWSQGYLAWKTGREVDGSFEWVAPDVINKFINGRLATWPAARTRICEALEMAEADVFPECFEVE